jgi:hypothetical protein
MSQQSVGRAVRRQALELPEPAAPSYQPSYTLAEQLLYDQRADAELTDAQTAELMAPSFTTIVDNGWDRWHMMVLPGEPDRLTLQLQVADHITWWKKIEVKASFFGFFVNIRTLGTVDATKVATTDLTAADSPQTGVLNLDFWKAGIINTGSYVTSQVLHLPSYLGNKVIYLCTRDHPSQP